MSSDALPRSAAKPGVSPYVVAMLVSFGTLFETLDSTALSVALNTVAGNLGATAEESDTVITAYLVANAAVMPISGWAATFFGRKRWFITCIVLFTLASILCACAWSIESLIFFRVLQGAAAAGNAASESSIIADSFPPEKRGQGFAIYGLAVVIGPTVGPILGGWATDNYSWSLIFWSNVPVGILAVAACLLLLQDSPALVKATAKRRARGLRLDWVGLALAVFGLIALQIITDKGQTEDWFDSRMIVAAAVIAAVCLVALPFWEASRDDPILDVRLFANPDFAISLVLLFGLAMVLFAGTSIFPLFLVQSFDYTATWAGLTLALGGGVVLVLMPVAGILSGKPPARYLLWFGFDTMALGMFLSSGIYTDYSFNQLSLLRVTQTIGIGFMFVALQSQAYVGVAGRSSEQVGSFLNLARNMGGSVGTAIAITLLERGRQTYRSDLAVYASPYRDEYRAAIAQCGSVDALNRVVDAQATVLAYQNVFFVLACIAGLCLPLIFFLRGKPGAPSQ